MSLKIGLSVLTIGAVKIESPFNMAKGVSPKKL